MMKKFSLIAACCDNGGIGVNQKLPWRLKNEMNYFNRITTITTSGGEGGDDGKRNAVIMGRKTWFSIPDKFRPLRDRVNLVVSRQLDGKIPIECDGVYASVESAIEGASSMDSVDRIFIVGGEKIYQESLQFPQCYRIYLTRIHAHFDCDTFFPKFDENLFQEITSDQVPQGVQEENGLKYTFHLYERKET
ncbi:dihydrofolate reductase [Brevipalpus obovatus]|uniref:dihydrofolate reductase n=1 Tax=Brevipalpus obovatus TaxID=246614 RepID=UPI003D9E7649